MKKTMIVVAAVAMVAGMVSADLAVDWKSTGAAVYDIGGSGGTGPFIEGAKLQLVWSAAGITTVNDTAYPLVGGATLPGEFVLGGDQVTGTFGTWSDLGGIFSNDDVGGANINAGFFFARIFQGTAAAGEYFVDIPMGNAAEYIYDSGTPSTVFSSDTVAASTWIDQNGTTVIPEPATLGLMGVAGLGMFLARRKARR